MSRRPLVVIGVVAALVVGSACSSDDDDPAAATTEDTTTTSTVVRPTQQEPATDGGDTNVYAHASAADLSPIVAGDLPRVYVPNSGSGTVSVIDPSTFRVVQTFPTGQVPQHVVPSYDLRTLWV